MELRNLAVDIECLRDLWLSQVYSGGIWKQRPRPQKEIQDWQINFLPPPPIFSHKSCVLRMLMLSQLLLSTVDEARYSQYAILNSNHQ